MEVLSKLNKFLKKLKSDLTKSSELIQDTNKLVSNDKATNDSNTRDVEMKRKTKEKLEDREIRSGV